MTSPISSVERNLGAVALLLLLGGCVLVLLPFVSALLWAVVLCFSVWPLYQRLLRLLRNRRSLAAGLMAFAMIGAVLLPFVVIGATLADNVHDLAGATRRWLDAGPPAPPAWLANVPVIGQAITDSWRSFASDSGKLWEAARGIVEPVASAALGLGIALGGGLMQLALSIFLAFFLFRDGQSLADALAHVVGRIAGEQGGRLLTLAATTVRGVVYGILGTALAQAVIAGIGFAIAGVPGAGLLALLTFFLSVVPVGPPLVWIPASLWLFHSAGTGWGVFMLVWGVGVSSVDNVVKPWLISQGSDMPFVLVLMGVLGGAFAFGFIGVFLGPTLLAVGYRLVAEWIATRRPPAAGAAPAAGS